MRRASWSIWRRKALGAPASTSGRPCNPAKGTVRRPATQLSGAPTSRCRAVNSALSRRRARAARQDADVDLAVLQPLVDRRAHAIAHAQADARIAPAQLQIGARQVLRIDRGQHADADLTGRLLDLPRQILAQRLARLQPGQHARIQAAPGLGQPRRDPCAGTGGRRRLLHRRQLAADGRLRAIAQGGDLGQAAQIGDLDEQAPLIQRQRSHEAPGEKTRAASDMTKVYLLSLSCPVFASHGVQTGQDP